MSKFSALVVFTFLTASIANADSTKKGEFRVEDGRCFVLAQDKTGITREYKVINKDKFTLKCLHQHGKQVTVKGTFKDQGQRTGTLKLVKISEEFFDPLGMVKEP